MLADIKIEIKKEGRLIISLYQAASIRSLIRYNAHSILMSEGGQGTVRCSKCGQSFNSQSELDKYNRSQHGV